MRRFSKMFGSGGGAIVGMLIASFLPETTSPEQAQAIQALIIAGMGAVGTYLAPANAPAKP
jgi:hypothetical protein